MVEVAGSARRLLKRLVAAKPEVGPVDPGVPHAADGNSAVATVEGLVADAVTLAASYPAAPAVRRAAAGKGIRNAFGRVLTVLDCPSSRAAVAAAAGYARSGGRASTFLAGNDLLRNLDVLREAVGGELPLVLHLAQRAPAGAGEPAGSGHEALYAAAETGAVVLVAADVQDAVDLTLVGRHLAESALVPVVVAMDGEETALSVQDMHLPGASLVGAFLGEAEALVHPASPSQKMLFGDHRRRVPARHDPERPYLTGAKTDPWTHALAEGGRALYREPHRHEAVREAFTRWGKATGRVREDFDAYRVDDAQVVFLTVGAAAGTLRAAVDALRARRIKAGVIGIRVLHPFPGPALVARLKGKRTVAVMERVNPPHGVDPWLLSRVREGLFRALSPGRGDGGSDPDYPTLAARDIPRLVSVRYGLGGLPLEAADLLKLGEMLGKDCPTPLFLGVSFVSERSLYPKRQVLLDELRRAYPEAEARGVRGREPAPRTLPATATCIRVVRRAGRAGTTLVAEAAALLHRLQGGHCRTLTSPVWERWERVTGDQLVFGKEPLELPGADTGADVTVWLAGGIDPLPIPEGALASGGTILIERDPGVTSFWENLPATVRFEIARLQLQVFAVDRGETEGAEREERLLGALVGVLLARQRLEGKPRKLIEQRRALLEDLPEPQVEARLAAFQAGLDRVLVVESGGPRREKEEGTVPDPKTPEVVRRLRRTDDAQDSLARFWDQVGILHARGESRELVPDPYLAAGVMPPLSSAFQDLASARERIPVFDPARCTGCGECWSACPDEAMSPVALAPGALLEAGLTLAKENGRPADALRPVLGKIAAKLTETMAKDPAGGGRLGAWLEPACEQVLARTPGNEERKAALREAADHLCSELAALPAARTAPFFERAAATAPGTGEVLSLAINAEACKGCGVCVAVCEPSALSRVVQDTAVLEEARETWNLLEKLPATDPATLERVRGDAEVGPVAAALLTREARVAFVGGDGAEPGSGEKIALRQVLALTTIHFQRHLSEYLQTLEELETRLSEEIRRLMSDALPTADLQALSQGLDRVDRSHVEIGELTGRVEAALETGRVEVPRLRRLVDVTRRVSDLRLRVTRGEGELGRAPYSLVVGPGSAAAWMAAFPNNPFAVPVTVDATGETLGLARGVLEGRLAAAAREATLLRRARRELEAPREAAAEEFAELTWEDLTEEERRPVPPFFVVLNEQRARGESGTLLPLLSSGLPVRILFLSEADLGLPVGVGPLGPEAGAGSDAFDLDMVSFGLTGSFVAQCSLAHHEHLEGSLRDALTVEGPALLRLHVPSPVRHGFPEDRAVDRARDAVAARAFPLFRFRPAGNGVLPSLEGNPEPDRLWAPDEAGNPLTPVHWARGERRFEGAFRTVEEGEETLPVAAWFELDPREREGKTAVVEGPDGEPLAVAPALLLRMNATVRVWTLLRALAAPSPAAVIPSGEPVPADIQRQHDALLEEVRLEYEARMQDLGARLKVEMAYRVRERLLELLARRGGNGSPGVPA